MEIFMRSVSLSCTSDDLQRALSDIFYKSPFRELSRQLIDFQVFMFQDQYLVHDHSGLGTLTLPTKEIGQRFLLDYGGDSPSRFLTLNLQTIKFFPSKNPPRSEVLKQISLSCYASSLLPARQDHSPSHARDHVSISVETIQFGWECRDHTFSIEWEKNVAPSSDISFNNDRKELCLRVRDAALDDDSQDISIFIPYSHISFLSAHSRILKDHVVYISLAYTPRFELSQPQECTKANDEKASSGFSRYRLTSLPWDNHSHVVAYLSLAIRIVFPTLKDLAQFRLLCAVSQLRSVASAEYPAEHRNVFSLPKLALLQDLIAMLPWAVAFQTEALIRALDVDATEMLRLLPRIRKMSRQYGEYYTASFLRVFRNHMRASWFADPDQSNGRSSVEVPDSCFSQAELKHQRITDGFSHDRAGEDTSIFQCLHATVTPTTVYLSGPFPERSNRVIRMFPGHHDSFLRVNFVDENGARYNIDYEVDGRQFVSKRFGTILKEGLEIGGRKFSFLGYSMSALKEHAVWFMKPFVFEHAPGSFKSVSATSVINGLGIFDTKTRRCPARYAARIAQAFTATDHSAISVNRIEEEEDIETVDGEYCFTDGVGKISLDLAERIWSERQAKRVRKGSEPRPSAFQVRFQGAKGMLTVDYRLTGSVVVARKSMIKFRVNATSAANVEVVQAFDRPMPFFLNRPLIMLLEGLGVDYEVFEQYQDSAVDDIQTARKNLTTTASMLERHSLGTSFRASYVLNNLVALDAKYPQGDEFYERSLRFAANYILRDFKNHARIPVHEGVTLVGVCDDHEQLEEGEVYACVRQRNGEVYYLEGEVLIFRPPIAALGDVQIARAIGRPLDDSPFAREPLTNTIVFSVKGDRPLPSCLGGGDLDGDTYSIVPLEKCPKLRPERIEQPAAYPQAPRAELPDRDSTMDDIADFVVDSICSDVVGIIASNWLVIADQSTKGVYDDRCQQLSELHSLAVDYPKSGRPVPTHAIPRPIYPQKPDWSAPETANVDDPKFYKSSRALGRLFCRIDVDDIEPRKEQARQVPRLRRAHNIDPKATARELARALSSPAPLDGAISPIENKVKSIIGEAPLYTQDEIDAIARLYCRYARELQDVCATHVITRRPGRAEMLTEEEVFIGTVLEKASQTRRRNKVISTLREHTDYIVRDVQNELVNAESGELETALRRAWVAWRLATMEDRAFGAKTFEWIAMGAIFKTIELIENAKRTESGASGA